MSATLALFRSQDVPGIKEIFFETSSKKEFKDDEEREKFFWKYVGFYLQHYPQYAFVALDQNQVLGYVVAMPESDNEALFKIQPHMPLFKEFFKEYPGHLHINLHHTARGLGLGSKLLIECEKTLQTTKITGLHIMTGPTSRNQSFYLKLGFMAQVELNFHGSPIVLMGKSLGN